METWLRLLLAVLATWRVTHLLAREKGPWTAVTRLRAWPGAGVLSLMECFYCLSVWVAAPFSCFVVRLPLEVLVAWLAVSGGACLLERITAPPDAVASME
ncbi:MAG: DUF1360 domain-containing protein [Longimicrobiaceae bacterium]|jgi:hypothetical protein